MDFSVRQLDSTQRKLVFSDSSYGNRTKYSSYICQADGRYEIYLTEEGYACNDLFSVVYLNNNEILRGATDGRNDYNEDGQYYSYGITTKTDQYLNKNDIITFNLIASQLLPSCVIYFTPYK